MARHVFSALPLYTNSWHVLQVKIKPASIYFHKVRGCGYRRDSNVTTTDINFQSKQVQYLKHAFIRFIITFCVEYY